MLVQIITTYNTHINGTDQLEGVGRLEYLQLV